MKRTALKRRTPLRNRKPAFGRPAPAPLYNPEEREEARRLRMLAQLEAGLLGVREAIMGGRTTGPMPKQPADRNNAARALAEGEECCFQLPNLCRGPDTRYTVLCHTNTQRDMKGMGYKGHDSEGVAGCDRCHEAIDQRWLSDPEIEKAWSLAKLRWLYRLELIAESLAEKLWRRRAARWVLDRQAERRAKESA